MIEQCCSVSRLGQQTSAELVIFDSYPSLIIRNNSVQTLKAGFCCSEVRMLSYFKGNYFAKGLGIRRKLGFSEVNS